MCHVLIIEDEPMIALFLQDILEEAGATSFAVAATEHDAVSLALQQRPSVITSDMRLLKGTGPRAVEQITQQIGKVPVIFISANPELCSWPNPPIAVLAKPFSYHEAITVFQRVVPH
ncbi:MULTISPECIES: response regulator [unclassified Sphingomonas]|uniref:response regulator n=1 Tax=unclassified Sphingomonas TaxID=196159 RepID=UPI002269FC5B|nr:MULTISPECIES: response regulator [unclassified Sphingomonas]